MFRPLYKLTSTGATEQWQIFVRGDEFWTKHGQLNGAVTETKPTKCKKKNVGKINETTENEQAILEAQAKYDKKLKSGYKENIKDIAEFTFYKPMLAHKYEDYESKIGFPVYSNEKLDGQRCITSSNGMFSRSGEKINSCPFIFSALAPIFKLYPDMIIDGELYSHEYKHNFNSLMSLLRKQSPTLEEIEECKKYVKYHVYDFPRLDLDRGEEVNFYDRFKVGKQLLSQTPFTKIVNAVDINDIKELDFMLEQYLNNGYEGQIVRLNKPYENKRSKNLLKRKIFQDAEYKILSINEGLGDRQNTAASVTCITSDGKTFNAGIIGDLDYARQLLVSSGNVGKMATIVFFNLTPDGIPRFGKLKAIRDYE
jgi:DNA ligase-1